MQRKFMIGSAAVSAVFILSGLLQLYYSKKQRKSDFDVEDVARDVMVKFKECFPQTIAIPQSNKFSIVSYHQLNLNKNSNHFIHVALRTVDCIQDLIYVFPHELDGDSPKSAIILIKLGNFVDGHNGIVHGGLVSAIIDEMFGALFFKANTHNKSIHGVTANLNINYRKPVKPNKWIIWFGAIEKVENRKTFLMAKIFNMNLELLADSTCLFVVPKDK